MFEKKSGNPQFLIKNYGWIVIGVTWIGFKESGLTV